MPKNRAPLVQPLQRKPSGDLRIKLSAQQPQARSAVSTKNKKKPARADVLRLHHNEPPTYLSRPIPWWVASDKRGLLHPGGPGHSPGQGPHPNVNPPGQFPPPPPPHPFPPGSGPFPPPPPPHPFPPGPGPFPIPIPVPIPGPQPVPWPNFITVTIVGGSSFQGVNYTNFIPFYPGITIRQALASTGIVGFGPLGFINNVAGIPVAGGVNVRLRYNGRVIPQTLLSFPAEPGSFIRLELYFAF